jgi:hypothetical protein
MPIIPDSDEGVFSFAFGTARGLSAGTLAKAKAIYGTRRLVPGYVGNAYTLTRTDAQILNVPFKADGTVDTAAIATWLGTDTGRVTSWYDQKGSGSVMTQTVAANRPYWAKNGRPGERGAIAMGVTAAPQRFMDIPGAVATNALDVSIIAMQQMNDRSLHTFAPTIPAIQLGSASGVGCTLYGALFETMTPDPTDPADFRIAMSSSVGGTVRNSGLVNTFRPSNCAPAIVSMRSLASGINWRSGSRVATAAAGAAFSGTGGTLGQSNFTTNANYSTNFFALIISSGYTDAEEAAAISELRSIYGVGSPQNVLVWDGDSITSGYETATSFDDRMTSPAYLLRTSMGNNWEMHCLSISGGSTVTGNGHDRVYPAPDSVDALYDATLFPGRRISVLMIGASDIFASVPAATIQTGIQTYCNARRAKGWEVIVCNILPSNAWAAPQNTIRTTVNSWLVANWSSFATAFADVSGAVDWTAGGYLTYTQEGTFPNAAGAAVLADTVRARI